MNKNSAGDVSDRTQTIYILDLIKKRLMESEVLIRQAGANRREQFRISPDLISGVRDALTEVYDTHEQLSREILDCHDNLETLLDRLVDSEGLYEDLRKKMKTLG